MVGSIPHGVGSAESRARPPTVVWQDGDRVGGAPAREDRNVLRNPDHITVAVADAEPAIAFFALLGFEQGHVATIDGGPPARYMGMPDMKAQHITLVLAGSEPRFEIQLLVFEPTPHEDAARTRRTSGAAATTISHSASTTSPRRPPTSRRTA